MHKTELQAFLEDHLPDVVLGSYIFLLYISIFCIYLYIIDIIIYSHLGRCGLWP